MVKNRHHDIPELGFASPVGTPAGIEVMTFTELRSRVGGRALGAPRRPAFHQLLNLSRGALHHTVDFTDYTVEPGSWLWIRPGQVQQWGDLQLTEGTLILFEQDFLDPATATTARLDDPYAPLVYEPGHDQLQSLRDAADHLGRAFGAVGQLPLDVQQTVLRHLLAVLVLRLAHLAAPAGAVVPEPGDTFVRFRTAVEVEFTRTRRLKDYADALRYDPRTLSRATQAATGVNAKEFIDRRVVLEAKRLLAHSDHTAAQIAAHLGFSSATNFSKYFHQRTGTTPIAFRANVRGG
ncbi:helix-turn-helix domain-containing protein [Dactylosporangium salmoneum]|uniref:AraC family transcriptional regulator n=1 Tax=Dactylosporangium salmoneum TaxID=53361 RepID=A0ABN3GMR4_9ACTN